MISGKGENLGVMTREKALALARPDEGLDLIEIAPSAKPPVARLMSFDKYRYEQEKAEKKARQVKQVTGVRNLIAVQTANVSDAELFERLARKLVYDGFGRSNTFNYLALDVRHGVVTVLGQVRDEYAHKSAVDIVRKEEGVRGVVDRVGVSSGSSYDDRLRFSIARAIYGDPVLRRYALDPSSPIRIVVDGGKVALYGIVSSRMDSQVAEFRAREVGGSFSVENHLLVTQDMPH